MPSSGQARNWKLLKGFRYEPSLRNGVSTNRPGILLKTQVWLSHLGRGLSVYTSNKLPGYAHVAAPV